MTAGDKPWVKTYAKYKHTPCDSEGVYKNNKYLGIRWDSWSGWHLLVHHITWDIIYCPNCGLKLEDPEPRQDKEK